MDLKITTKIFNFFKKIGSTTMLFWFIETLFFIIKDGFHIKATTEWEKNCDKIVGYGMNITIILFVLTIYGVVDYLLSDEEE